MIVASYHYGWYKWVYSPQLVHIMIYMPPIFFGYIYIIWYNRQQTWMPRGLTKKNGVYCNLTNIHGDIMWCFEGDIPYSKRDVMWVYLKLAYTPNRFRPALCRPSSVSNSVEPVDFCECWSIDEEFNITKKSGNTMGQWGYYGDMFQDLGWSWIYWSFFLLTCPWIHLYWESVAFFSLKQIQRLILADDWQLHRLRQIIKRGRRIPDGAFQQATIAGGFYLVHWGSYILLNYAVILCIALCLHYGWIKPPVRKMVGPSETVPSFLGSWWCMI